MLPSDYTMYDNGKIGHLHIVADTDGLIDTTSSFLGGFGITGGSWDEPSQSIRLDVGDGHSSANIYTGYLLWNADEGNFVLAGIVSVYEGHAQPTEVHGWYAQTGEFIPPIPDPGTALTQPEGDWDLITDGIWSSLSIRQATGGSLVAVSSRYPGMILPVTWDASSQAITLAVYYDSATAADYGAGDSEQYAGYLMNNISEGTCAMAGSMALYERSTHPSESHGWYATRFKPSLGTPPYIGFQLAACVDFLNTSSNPDFRTTLTQLVQTAVKGLVSGNPIVAATFPDVLVDSECIDKNEKLGVWPSWISHQARNNSLHTLDLLSGGNGPEGYGFASLVNADMLQQVTGALWTSLKIGGDGQPDPNGRILLNDDGTPNPQGSNELLGYELSFVPPNEVHLDANGVRHGTVDIPFAVHYQDIITIDADLNVQCDTHGSLDLPWWTHLLNILFVPFPAEILLETVYLSPTAPSLNQAGSGTSGIGCFATRVFPKEIYLAGNQKLSFSYNDVSSDNRGLVAMGPSPLVETREPNIQLNGPLAPQDDGTYRVITDPTVFIPRYNDMTVAFASTTHDLRDPEFSWESSGSATLIAVSPPASTDGGLHVTSLATFRLPAREIPTGATQVSAGHVFVVATDADGLSASAEQELTFRVVDANASDDPSPPWTGPTGG